MDEPQKNVPREPSDTQDWIRERFGGLYSPERRADLERGKEWRDAERRWRRQGRQGRYQGRE